MTYNEWRDELKSNLLSVTESERRRVLDYYAEAYADRRDAGFSERQIIEDFGAPYDAAQRILLNMYEQNNVEEEEPIVNENINKQKEQNKTFRQNKQEEKAKCVDAEIVKENNKSLPKKDKDYTWLFVVFCVIFAIPLFGIIMGMIGVSVGFIVAPFAVLIAGVATIIFGIIECFSSVINGVFSIGEGLLELGIGLILLPLMLKLIKIMWKLLKNAFKYISRFFSGKEYTK